MSARISATTRLVLLPPQADAPVHCLTVDPNGRVLEHLRLADGAPLPAAAAGSRCVLAVPGEHVRTLSLQLPLRNPLQARAAALLRLEGELAGEGEPHLALGPVDAEGHRLAVVVDASQMRAWLTRAATLGLEPDLVVPDHLLLPPVAEGEPVAVAALDERVLVRDPRGGFSAEATLAEAVLGPRPRQSPWSGAQAWEVLARGALHPPLDLRQYAFAQRTDDQASPWRRLRWMAALLIASPLLLVAAEALRLEASRHLLVQRARALAADVATPTQAQIDPVAASDARLAELRGSDGFGGLLAALLHALQAQPGVRIEALDYAPGRLRAQLAHADAARLQAVQDTLQSAGMRAAADAGERTADGLRTRLTVESAP